MLMFFKHTRCCIYTLLLSVPVTFCAHAQNDNSAYEMVFTYKNKDGNVKDTIISTMNIQFWNRFDTFPKSLKWKNTPFIIKKSEKHGIGLFTDSDNRIKSGEKIGLVFYKIGSTGKFNVDYIESEMGGFVNDSDTPNAEVVKTAEGLVMKAIKNIDKNTEITASYKDLLKLFPNDKTAEKKIKYW